MKCVAACIHTFRGIYPVFALMGNSPILVVRICLSASISSLQCTILKSHNKIHNLFVYLIKHIQNTLPSNTCQDMHHTESCVCFTRHLMSDHKSRLVSCVRSCSNSLHIKCQKVPSRDWCAEYNVTKARGNIIARTVLQSTISYFGY